MLLDILKELAGDCHQVYTGVTLIKNNNVVSNFAEKTDVYCMILVIMR